MALEYRAQWMSASWLCWGLKLVICVPRLCKTMLSSYEALCGWKEFPRAILRFHAIEASSFRARPSWKHPRIRRIFQAQIQWVSTPTPHVRGLGSCALGRELTWFAKLTADTSWTGAMGRAQRVLANG